ncbi:hypothetical protein OAE79_00665 [Rhodopirellula sp.]|nr:hypothetical protein [Rhodopirellula sp.]
MGKPNRPKCLTEQVKFLALPTPIMQREKSALTRLQNIKPPIFICTPNVVQNQFISSIF